MLKLKNGCKTCLLVKNNKQLLKRIYDSSYFIPHSEDSLRKIAQDYKEYFSYPALINHVKKHQFINATDYKDKMMRQVVKQAETKVIMERFQPNNVQDAVINKGMEKLESGEMNLTATHLLKAAKDKFDAQAKTRDQQLQLAEMVAFFASGEDDQENVHARKREVIDVTDYDPSIPVTEDITTRP